MWYKTARQLTCRNGTKGTLTWTLPNREEWNESAQPICKRLYKWASWSAWTGCQPASGNNAQKCNAAASTRRRSCINIAKAASNDSNCRALHPGTVGSMSIACGTRDDWKKLGKFVCQEKTKCIPLTKICDGRVDCAGTK